MLIRVDPAAGATHELDASRFFRSSALPASTYLAAEPGGASATLSSHVVAPMKHEAKSRAGSASAGGAAPHTLAGLDSGYGIGWVSDATAREVLRIE